MDTPYQASPDVWVLPTTLPIPGAGSLVTNAFVILSEEPVLVDTGIGVDSGDFMDALDSILPMDHLRWIWLTHDDADHIGSIQSVMELAPQARLVAHAFSALRMASWWPVPLERVNALVVGERLHVGDRTLTAVRPPLYDNPMSTGIYDDKTGTLFSVDAFGAILPEVTQDAADIPEADLSQGMIDWAAFDSPWTQLVDGGKFALALKEVERLAPSRILSSHLPPASASIDRLVAVLKAVPDAEPFLPPDQVTFEQMIAAMPHPNH